MKIEVVNSKINLYLKILLGSVTCFLTIVTLAVFFKRWDFFDLNNRSLQSIIIEGIILSIVFFVFMFLYSKSRLKKRQMDKTK